MNPIHALILGIVQGLTEYLPVSSSAHLVLVPALFQFDLSSTDSFIFDVLVQLGTLVGVLIYFSDDIKHMIVATTQGILKGRPFENDVAKQAWLIVLATIPASVIGLLFKDEIAATFDSARTAAGCLYVTAALLCLAELIRHAHRSQVLVKDSILIGFAQALALLPGISRSGSTIAIGMLSGLNRTTSARFSFLMSIPVMIGASLIAGKDLLQGSQSSFQGQIFPLVIGFISAAVTGYFVIKWFLHFLRNQSLLWFAAYCIVFATISLIYL